MNNFSILFEDTRALYIIAKQGSINKASKLLGVSQQTLSKRVSRFEEKLGEPIFERYVKGVVLTPAGEAYLEHVGSAFHMQDFKKSDFDEKLNVLNVGTTFGMSETITEHSSQLFKMDSKIGLNVVPTLNIFAVKFGAVDVIISPTPHYNPHFVQHFLYNCRMRLFASKKYFEQFPHPKSMDDLRNHRLVLYTTDQGKIHDINLHWKKNGQNLPPVMVNNGPHLKNAILSGSGIGFISFNTGYDMQDLVDVFPQQSDYTLPYYLIYNQNAKNLKSIKTFHKFMKKIVENWV